MTKSDNDRKAWRIGDAIREFLRHENAVLIIILLLIVVVFGVASKGTSVSAGNIKNVLLQSSMRGIASVGQGLVLMTAHFDLSVGGQATMISLLGASLLTSSKRTSLLGFPLPPVSVIAIMLMAGLCVGSFNGFSVSRLRMPALIVTLTVWQITNGLAYQIGHGRSIAGLPEVMSFFGQGQVLGLPVPVIIFITVALIGYYVLNYTSFGRSIYAVGGNPNSAYLSGIKTKQIVFFVFVISGFLTAISGLIIMCRGMSASMLVAHGFELDTIAACVIGGVSLFGGRGNVIGIVIGVLIIGLLDNGMNLLGVDPPIQQVVKGAIIIFAVAIDTMRRNNP